MGLGLGFRIITHHAYNNYAGTFGTLSTICTRGHHHISKDYVHIFPVMLKKLSYLSEGRFPPKALLISFFKYKDCTLN